MYFPTTHWSLLARATLHAEPEARTALEELCRRYWVPLKRFIQMRGYNEAEAEDLTQEFLLHLLERSALQKPDASRGRFRSFLLGALSNFLSHERERRLTQKRGGQHPHISLESLANGKGVEQPTVPEQEAAEFDREWALTIVRSALTRVGNDYARSGRAALFNVLREYLPGESAPPIYEEGAARAGMSVEAFNSEVHRLRRRFRECVCAAVTATVSAPHEIDNEMNHLYRVLLDRGTSLCLKAEHPNP